MQVDFLAPYPLEPLEPPLLDLVRNAGRLDAAIAFVTRPGVALLRQYLKTHPRGSTRLVASVRFPTNLSELANLKEGFPDTARRLG